MRIWLDTEFNGFGGELISLAMVTETDKEWYEVMPLKGAPDAWVAEHVLPKLDRHPIEPWEFRQSFHRFVSRFPGCDVFADWPADFEHFCSLLTGIGAQAGYVIPIQCTMTLLRGSPDIRPEIPHNALSDARALRSWHQGELGIAAYLANEDGE